MGMEEKLKRLAEIAEEQKGGTAVADRKKSKKKLKPPGRWKVILHNDDFTPMEFVVFVLQEVFNKPEEVAVSIMLDVHKKGSGIAGVYSMQIAETKVFETLEYAKENEFPLKVTAEET